MLLKWEILEVDMPAGDIPPMSCSYSYGQYYFDSETVPIPPLDPTYRLIDRMNKCDKNYDRHVRDPGLTQSRRLVAPSEVAGLFGSMPGR
jgi:hypothetical protein